MKKIFTIIFINTIVLFAAKSQSFDLIAKTGFTLNDTIDTNDTFYDYKVEATFENTSTNKDDTVFVWEKVIISAPSEWISTVCDPKGCYGPEHTKAVFFVPVNSSKIQGMYVGFITQGVPGTAKLNLKIYPSDKPELAKVYSFTVNVSEPLSIKNKRNIATFTIYPNPCVKDIIIPTGVLSNAPSIGNIFNLEGKIVKTLNFNGANDLSIDVSDLSNGLYRIQFISDEGTKISQTFLKK